VSARIDADSQAALTGANALPPAYANPLAVAPVNADPDERWGGHSLPNDHPAWMHDTLSISGRARAMLERIKPVAVRVVAFWEHRVRSIAISGGKLSVDASGSYRLT